MASWELYLKNIYYNPANPASFAGLINFTDLFEKMANSFSVNTEYENGYDSSPTACKDH